MQALYHWHEARHVVVDGELVTEAFVLQRRWIIKIDECEIPSEFNDGSIQVSTKASEICEAS